MAPFLAANTFFPMYEIEAHHSSPTPYPRARAGKELQLQPSEPLHRVKSFNEKSTGYMEDKENGQNHQIENNVGNDLPFLVVESKTHGCFTTIGKILVKIPMAGWQAWKNKRAEKIASKSQPTKLGDSSKVLKPSSTFLQRDCSCSYPHDCCLCGWLAKERKEVEEAEKAAAAKYIESHRNSRWVISVFGKTRSLIPSKLSRWKTKGKGKGKEIDTARTEDLHAECHSSRQFLFDKGDGDITTPSQHIPWYPEFQSMPPLSCNCLLLKPDHEYLDWEIQKMRWFLDRVQVGRAGPSDWWQDGTQSCWERAALRWNYLHPLNSQPLYSPAIEPFSLLRLSSPPMRSISKTWILIESAVVPECTRIFNFVEPSLTNGQYTANLKKYLAEGQARAQARLNRPGLQIDTSINGNDQPGSTPNNTPQTAVNHNPSFPPKEEAPRTSVS